MHLLVLVSKVFFDSEPSLHASNCATLGQYRFKKKHTDKLEFSTELITIKETNKQLQSAISTLYVQSQFRVKNIPILSPTLVLAYAEDISCVSG